MHDAQQGCRAERPDGDDRRLGAEQRPLAEEIAGFELAQPMAFALDDQAAVYHEIKTVDRDPRCHDGAAGVDRDRGAELEKARE